MASAVASGCLPVAAPSLQLPKGRQVSGAANSCLLVRKSTLGDPGPKTSIQTRARPSPSRKAGHHKIYRLKVAAGAESNGNSEGEDSEKENSLRQSELKRRELLCAATGTFSYLSSAGLAQSAPVPAPDLYKKNCSPVILLTPGKTQDCCLPDASGLVPIQFEFENLPMRTRRPAHTIALNDPYVKKYNEAYRRMKALPDDDPRSFTNQWKVHGAFCVGGYLEPGNVNQQKLQYHFSWAFLPWHRWYLYFHERILGELIGDPSFALPFWNWDNQRPVGGNQIPLIFTDDNYRVPNDQLHYAIRDPGHLPPAYVDLAGLNNGNTDVIRKSNLGIMHKQVVSAVSALNFMGGEYVANQPQNSNSSGSCEMVHNTLHDFVGHKDKTRYPDNEDMGTLVYAGRDPLFYCHHANVDRLWTVWKNLPADEASTRSGTRPRDDHRALSFLNTEFAFYDHKKRLVHVKVSQSLDTSMLRYQYPSMPSDQDWINFKEQSSGEPTPEPGDFPPSKRSFPVLSPTEPTSITLPSRRPPNQKEIDHMAEEGLTPDDLEETLVIKGLEVPATSYMNYRVFINRPDADTNTPVGIFEFIGLITHIPHGEMGDASMSFDFRLSIGTAMKNLNLPLNETDMVLVTFVPINQEESVMFRGVTTEWR